MKGLFTLGLLGFILVLGSASATQDPFTYSPPGALTPGSGQGRVDANVYVPDMRFPLEVAPAYANSQVWGVGGSRGPAGDGQCDSRNYSYPWWDNYCETRDRRMSLCPLGMGHQGQDIRPATCSDSTHWAVAVEDGTITLTGTYSVYLQGNSGIRYRYLHLDRSSLEVTEGDEVQRGARIGLVSDNFGKSPTTIHLHFDIHSGGRYIPPYMTLVRSYEELLTTGGGP